MANYQLSHTGAKIDEAIGKALTALQTMPKHTHSVDDITGLNNTSSASVAYNLLDNSNFRDPVNQRGSTSYSGGGYTIDRWKENQTAMTVAVEDGYISLTNTSDSRRAFEQLLPNAHIGEVLTVAVKEHNSGEIYCASAVVPSASSNAQYFAAADFGAHTARLSMTAGGVLVFQVMVGNASPAALDWVALYEGEYTAENLPTYVPKGYAAELHECMRYYIRIPTTAQLTIIGYGYSATAGRFSIPVGVTMRAAPTLNFATMSSCRIYPGAITPTAIGGRAVVGPVVTFALTVASGLKADDIIVLRPGTMMEFSADL